MALLENASSYILGIITEDETVKNFPKEFITTSAKWIRSWFLKDDPLTTSIVENPTLPPSVKQPILDAKLQLLKTNPTFVQELETLLKNFEQEKTKRKGIVENATIEVQGHVHIGDKGNVSNDNYDEKNVVKGSTIKAGGDFRLGDDVFLGNEQVQIVHNYFGGKSAPNTPPQYVSVRAQVEALIAEGSTEKAITLLLDTQTLDDDLHNSILLQSGRINHLARQVNNGVLSLQESKIERARINVAILDLAKKL